MNEFSRTELIFGEEAINRLSKMRVAVFGLGGVGGYALEALARSGVGTLDIIDCDTVNVTNINRQIIALQSTLGQRKTDVFEQRIADINPMCTVNKHDVFYLPENADAFDFSVYDYVVDAVDTVSAKLDIIQRCKRLGVRVISSMGTGNKTEPTRLMVADIYDTSVCPLARVMRHELKKRGIDSLKVVYSEEKPAEAENPARAESGKPIPGSTAFVPPAAGLIIASEVIKDLIWR